MTKKQAIEMSYAFKNKQKKKLKNLLRSALAPHFNFLFFHTAKFRIPLNIFS